MKQAYNKIRNTLLVGYKFISATTLYLWDTSLYLGIQFISATLNYLKELILGVLSPSVECSVEGGREVSAGFRGCFYYKCRCAGEDVRRIRAE